MVRDAPPEIYEAISQGFREQRHGLLHPDYPEDLLNKRLEHYLSQMPFLYTGNYVWRMILRKGHLVFDDLLNIGKTSHRELIATSGHAFYSYGTLGLPYTLSSYDPDLHEHFAKVSAHEEVFLVLNEDAKDPWDDYSTLHCGVEARRRLTKLRAQLPASVELGSDPFIAWLYFEEPRDDIFEIAKSVSENFRALLITTVATSHTQKLYAQFQESDAHLGRLLTSYVREDPHTEVFRRYVRSAKRRSVKIHLLLGGKLHDYHF
ncbi:hypothetical protein KAI87_01560 [Myxococcota bacterium]|nr:hypothetical protein [Myxococcota bacterium]